MRGEPAIRMMTTKRIYKHVFCDNLQYSRGFRKPVVDQSFTTTIIKWLLPLQTLVHTVFKSSYRILMFTCIV